MRTFACVGHLTLWFKISESAFRIYQHNALGFSVAGAVGGQVFCPDADIFYKTQLPSLNTGSCSIDAAQEKL
jgi:hypothetical protein